MSSQANEQKPPLHPDEFTILLFGHAAFQYLFAASVLGLFPLLHRQPGLTKGEISEKLRLKEQAGRCLLFGLTSLRLITKDGEGYHNCSLINGFLERGQWKILYDTVMFEGRIVYPGQADFAESLRTGSNIGLRSIPGDGPDLYHRLAQNRDLQEVFYNYMSSWSLLANPLLMAGFDFSKMTKLLDVGGGDATNAIAIARAYPDVQICLLDLPGNAQVGRDRIAREGLANRIEVRESDIFAEEFPSNMDCVLFIHQLVIWPLDVCTRLLQRANRSLRPGGKVVIFSSISDDSEDGPVMSALDTVYFVSIPAPGGMIFAWKDYEQCLREAGFDNPRRIRCQSWTPHGILTAEKRA